MEHGRTLEQTLCLACIRGKRMERVERIFALEYGSRRNAVTLVSNNATVGPNFKSRNLNSYKLTQCHSLFRAIIKLTLN